MPRSALNALLTRATLERMAEIANESLHEALIDGRLEITQGEVPLKNVCAKLSVELSDDIDEVCSFLDISKRRFIEAAIIEALSQARAVMREEGIFESMERDNADA